MTPSSGGNWKGDSKSDATRKCLRSAEENSDALAKNNSQDADAGASSGRGQGARLKMIVQKRS
jgi:hypothetical protein